MSSAIRYDGPAHLRTRGTILVVPGRGGAQSTYTRLATRLAADSYHVRVLQPPDIDHVDLPGSVDRYGDVLAGEVDSDTALPLILVGADTGALVVAALADRVVNGVKPAAAVLAGIPGRASHDVGSWDDELVARTQCHVHRGVLSDDADVTRGALAGAVPGELFDAAERDQPLAPQLVLHGDDDPLASYAEVAQFVKVLPAAQLAVVAGAHHDVLNDIQHRSVAAAIVTFLERVRGSATLEPIVRVDYSTW